MRTFDVSYTRGATAERVSPFLEKDYLTNLYQQLVDSKPGQAIGIGDEPFSGGRDADSNGKGIAQSVATQVKAALGEFTDLNTKVHLIPDPEDSSSHWAALSINRNQPSYKVAKANPVKRNRKTEAKAKAAK